jgi:hypothetical protein
MGAYWQSGAVSNMRLLSHNNIADNSYARLNRREGESPLRLGLSTNSPTPETAKPSPNFTFCQTNMRKHKKGGDAAEKITIVFRNIMERLLLSQ